MKHNIRFIGMALVLGMVLAGCGTPKNAKAPSKKNDKPAVTAQAKSKESAKAESDKSQTQTQGQQPPSAGLPLGSVQSPSSIDDILNPSGKNQASAPLAGQGAPPPPGGMRPGPGMPPTPAPGQKLTAQQLLAGMQGIYASARSLKVEGVTGMLLKHDGKVIRQQRSSKFSLLFKRPNLFVMSSADGRLSSDGKNFSQYAASAKRFVTTPMTNDVIRGLVASKPGVGYIGLLMGMNYAQAVSSFKPLKEGNIGGKDTFVLTMVLKSPPGSSAVQTLWIGKKDLGVYKNELLVKVKPAPIKGFKGKMPKLAETYMVSTVSSFQPNSTIANSAFRFKPPTGAKPVEKPKEINLGGKPAPDFSFKWVDGSTKKLSDYRGQVVLLDFWALPMCEGHLPTLQGLYKDHKDNVQMVLISFNTKVDAVKDYMQKKGFSFPYVMANEEIASVASAKYGLRGLPSIFIIDKQGTVRATMLGQPSQKEIDAKLSKLGLDK